MGVRKVSEKKKKKKMEEVDSAKTRELEAKLAKAQDLHGMSAKDEIDSIFGNKKRKVSSEKAATTEDSSQQKKKSRKLVSPDVKKKKKKTAAKEFKEQKLGESLESASKPKRKTADGLTIYTEDDIKWNSKNAGGTPLCPFDCDCCF